MRRCERKLELVHQGNAKIILLLILLTLTCCQCIPRYIHVHCVISYIDKRVEVVLAKIQLTPNIHDPINVIADLVGLTHGEDIDNSP